MVYSYAIAELPCRKRPCSESIVPVYWDLPPYSGGISQKPYTSSHWTIFYQVTICIYMGSYVCISYSFYPLPFQVEGMLSLPAFVHLSVRLSVNFTLSAR